MYNLCKDIRYGKNATQKTIFGNINFTSTFAENLNPETIFVSKK